MTKKIFLKNCYLYVLDTLADWEIGFLTAELNSRRYLNKKVDLNFLMLGNTLESIKTMGGIEITPDKRISDINFQEGDLLILPGADTWQDEKNRKVLHVVSELINKKVIIAAICGATIALAQKDLLNNRKHTSNDKEFLKMVCPDYAGSSKYVDTLVVVDENLITATGLAPLEFSYEIFKKTNIMNEKTLEAWYRLYSTKESKYFYDLMESLK